MDYIHLLLPRYKIPYNDESYQTVKTAAASMHWPCMASLDDFAFRRGATFCSAAMQTALLRHLISTHPTVNVFV